MATSRKSLRIVLRAFENESQESHRSPFRSAEMPHHIVRLDNGSDHNVLDCPEQPSSAGFDQIEHLEIYWETLQVTEVPEICAKAVASLSQARGESDFAYSSRIEFRAIKLTEDCVALSYAVLIHAADLPGNFGESVNSFFPVHNGLGFADQRSEGLVPWIEDLATDFIEAELDSVSIALQLRRKSRGDARYTVVMLNSEILLREWSLGTKHTILDSSTRTVHVP